MKFVKIGLTVWFGHENRFLAFLRRLFGNPSSRSSWKLIKTYCEEKLFFRIKALDRFRICLGTAAERFLELQLRILAKMCLWVSTEKRFFVPSSFEYSSVRHSIERINFFSLSAGKMLLNSRNSISEQLPAAAVKLPSYPFSRAHEIDGFGCCHRKTSLFSVQGDRSCQGFVGKHLHR